MTLDRIVAAVLAGGVKKFSFKEFYHQLEDLFSYREWYFRKGYKSLKKMKLAGGITGKPKPMIEYILNTLKNTEKIDRILVVGPEKAKILLDKLWSVEKVSDIVDITILCERVAE